MENLAIADVRNFALMGHSGSGKTALVDAILFKLGLCERLGSTAAGSSAADYTDEEKNRRISIFAKPFAGVWKGAGGKRTGLVFIDTPGYMDFYGQLVAATRAADACVVVIDAASGVQVGARRAWKNAVKAGRARAVVVTGLDKDNTDFSRTLAAVQESFGAGCVPVSIPAPDRGAVVDVLGAKDVPAELADEVEMTKGSLIELAAETDDTLIEKFLGGESLSPDEIASGLKDAVARGGLVPVFACMPLKGIGVSELLDGLVRLLPSPAAVAREDAEGKPIAAAADAPFVGQVWRTLSDPFVGQLAVVRVLGGTLKGDGELSNATRGQKERAGSLLVINGKSQSPVASASAGEIVAVAKLKDTHVGDTLCAAGQSVQCAPIAFPKPVTFAAVRAKTQADEDKLGLALSRVCEEDPTLHVERNAATKEIVLQGLGDVHIDVAVERMKSRSNVEVTTATPRVSYRETVTALGEGHYRHKKQSGGRGQYGEVYLRVGPKPADAEDWFVDAIVGGVIPNNFIPAVQKGLAEAVQSGPLAGCPIVNVQVTLYDGSYHDVDSSEVAFKIAASRALREAMMNSKPVLLEPIMTVKISVPDGNMGDITGDLNQRRGRILGMGAEDGMQVVTAEVPQAEMFRYAAELRSMTSGQGAFEMEFSRYEIVPSNVAQKVIAEAARDKEEE